MSISDYVDAISNYRFAIVFKNSSFAIKCVSMAELAAHFMNESSLYYFSLQLMAEQSRAEQRMHVNYIPCGMLSVSQAVSHKQANIGRIRCKKRAML